MAALLPRRGSAFRDSPHLQQFILTDVTPTDRVLGTGSFGSVEEVVYQHRVCAGKRIHELLIDVENEGVGRVVKKYLQECQLMSSLHHPNITQFLGLCFLPGTQLPMLVMERLETSLDDLLEHMPNLPLSLKRSVLEDVASGLLYLHKRPTPIIHRDLTSKNVLLTSSLVAKITDMGNSRIVNMRPGQMARTLTEFPGTLVYMPPEALDDRHQYGPSLDVFSFGHLALFTIIQIFPGELLPATYINPENNQGLLPRSEVERRGEYIDLLESRSSLPALVQLVKQCLHNDPQQRPSTEELLTRLQGMRAEVEGEYGGPIKLDLVRVRLAKEVKEKDRRIQELIQDHVRYQEDMDGVLENATRQLEVRNRHIEELEGEIQAKDETIAAKDELITNKDDNVQRYQRFIQQLERELQELHGSMLRQEREISQLRARLRESQAQLTEQTLLKLPLQLTWRYGQNMPFAMVDNIQSVVVQGKLYAGGGYAGKDSDYNYIITEYDPISGEWDILPPYRSLDFTMVVVSSQLVVVGGYNYITDYFKDGYASKLLGVWNKKWTHPYPEMPTARSHCSAVFYNKWLVVAGGITNLRVLSSVEVLNTHTRQWHSLPSLPIPWFSMKAAVVGDAGYFMGGYTNNDKLVQFNYDFHEKDGDFPIVDAYSVPLSALTSSLDCMKNRELWKVMPRLHQVRSTPVSINGLLLAVGGLDRRSKATTSIHLYQPLKGDWVKVGDLQESQYDCTAATITGRELFVAGGHFNIQKFAIAEIGIA